MDEGGEEESVMLPEIPGGRRDAAQSLVGKGGRVNELCFIR